MVQSRWISSCVACCSAMVKNSMGTSTWWYLEHIGRLGARVPWLPLGRWPSEVPPPAYGFVPPGLRAGGMGAQCADPSTMAQVPG